MAALELNFLVHPAAARAEQANFLKQVICTYFYTSYQSGSLQNPDTKSHNPKNPELGIMSNQKQILLFQGMANKLVFRKSILKIPCSKFDLVFFLFIKTGRKLKKRFRKVKLCIDLRKVNYLLLKIMIKNKK